MQHQEILQPQTNRAMPGILAFLATCALGGAHLIVNTASFLTESPKNYGLYGGYVLGVSAVCLVFALAALALYQSWGQRLPQRGLQIVTWIGCAVISLLAIYTLTLAITTQDLRYLTFAGPGPWSLLAGPLLGFAAWRSGAEQ